MLTLKFEEVLRPSCQPPQGSKRSDQHLRGSRHPDAPQERFQLLRKPWNAFTKAGQNGVHLLLVGTLDIGMMHHGRLNV